MLLRIINQSMSQCESSKNFELDNEYSTLFKVDNSCMSDGETPFEKARREYFESVYGEGMSPPEIEGFHIVGFVMGQSGKQHPVKAHEVAYIVNTDGKTLERVYGHYKKY